MHTPCRTNPNSLSQTRCIGTVISVHHDLREFFSSGYTLIPMRPINQTTINIVIYIHNDLVENKYQKSWWYGHTPGRTNPKHLLQTEIMGTVISVHHNLWAKISSEPLN